MVFYIVLINELSERLRKIKKLQFFKKMLVNVRVVTKNEDRYKNEKSDKENSKYNK